MSDKEPIAKGLFEYVLYTVIYVATIMFTCACITAIGLRVLEWIGLTDCVLR